jgi:hypothetical protein
VRDGTLTIQQWEPALGAVEVPGRPRRARVPACAAKCGEPGLLLMEITELLPTRLDLPGGDKPVHIATQRWALEPVQTRCADLANHPANNCCGYRIHDASGSMPPVCTGKTVLRQSLRSLAPRTPQAHAVPAWSQRRRFRGDALRRTLETVKCQRSRHGNYQMNQGIAADSRRTRSADGLASREGGGIRGGGSAHQRIGGPGS